MYNDSLSPHRVNYFEKDKARINDNFKNDREGMQKRRAAELESNFSKKSHSQQRLESVG
jgi:hypothetical protein